MQRSRLIGRTLAAAALVPLGALGLEAVAAPTTGPAVPASGRPAAVPAAGRGAPDSNLVLAAPESIRNATTIRIDGPAVMRAQGAAITLPVSVTCPTPPAPSPEPEPRPFPSPVPESSLSIQATQAIGGGTTGGYGNASVVCDGTPHVVKVDVMVTAPTPPFKPGVAFGRADLYICGPEFCGPVSDSGEITIAGKAQ